MIMSSASPVTTQRLLRQSSNDRLLQSKALHCNGLLACGEEATTTISLPAGDCSETLHDSVAVESRDGYGDRAFVVKQGQRVVCPHTPLLVEVPMVSAPSVGCIARHCSHCMRSLVAVDDVWDLFSSVIRSEIFHRLDGNVAVVDTVLSRLQKQWPCGWSPENVITCDQCDHVWCSQRCREMAAAYHGALCPVTEQLNAILISCEDHFSNPVDFGTHLVLVCRMIAQQMSSETNKSRYDFLVDSYNMPNCVRDFLEDASGKLFPDLAPGAMSNMWSRVSSNVMSISCSPMERFLDGLDVVLGNVVARDGRRLVTTLGRAAYDKIAELEHHINSMTATHGVAIYKVQSSINHSCTPNAVCTSWLTDDHTIVAVSKAHIAPSEQIFITYIDETKFEDRKRLLRDGYGIESCKCQACVSGTATTGSEANAIRFPRRLFCARGRLLESLRFVQYLSSVHKVDSDESSAVLEGLFPPGAPSSSPLLRESQIMALIRALRYTRTIFQTEMLTGMPFALCDHHHHHHGGKSGAFDVVLSRSKWVQFITSTSTDCQKFLDSSDPCPPKLLCAVLSFVHEQCLIGQKVECAVGGFDHKKKRFLSHCLLDAVERSLDSENEELTAMMIMETTVAEKEDGENTDIKKTIPEMIDVVLRSAFIECCAKLLKLSSRFV
eukprot:PhM_4_TR13892/c0_g1_i1/m.36202